MEIVKPNGWARPSGYSHGIAVNGNLIFVSGQVGWDEGQRFRSPDLVEQIATALQNTVDILQEAGATASDVVRMTWYYLDLDEYRRRTKEIGDVYKSKMGKHYPAMTVVEVAALMEPEARVEIETTAIVRARCGAEGGGKSNV